MNNTDTPVYGFRYTFRGECAYERLMGKSAERVRRKFIKTIKAFFSKDPEEQVLEPEDMVQNVDVQDLAFICLYHKKNHPKSVDETDLPPTDKEREIFKNELVLALIQDLNVRLQEVETPTEE
jgi:hypothetical protein